MSRTLLLPNNLSENLVLPGTGAITVPYGITSERPASPTNGMVRYNSTTSKYEVYIDEWLDIATSLKLDNGMPAYVEPVGSVLISIDSITYIYVNKTNGARNFYMSIAGDIASNLVGYAMPRNALIKNLVLVTSANTVANVDIQLRVNGSTTPSYSQTATAGSRKYAFDLSWQLNNLDEIAVYLGATSNIANPVCILNVSWRN